MPTRQYICQSPAQHIFSRFVDPKRQGEPLALVGCPKCRRPARLIALEAFNEMQTPKQALTTAHESKGNSRT
jgi:hypothetical protein